MDESDRATQEEEFARVDALSRRKDSNIYLSGACWNCENPTDGLFCDTYCCEDWMKRDEADKRAGI